MRRRERQVTQYWYYVIKRSLKRGLTPKQIRFNTGWSLATIRNVEKAESYPDFVYQLGRRTQVIQDRALTIPTPFYKSLWFFAMIIVILFTIQFVK